MSGMTITVDFVAGTSIEEAYLDSLGLAIKLHTAVSFDLNDVKCVVMPSDTTWDQRKFVSNYRRVLNDPNAVKLVYAR